MRGQKNRVTSLLVGLLFLTATMSAIAQTQLSKPRSGQYDYTLSLVVQPAGSIVGSFYDETGRGQFSCGFLLYSNGKPDAQGNYKVKTWWPFRELGINQLDDDIAWGTLSFAGGTAYLQLPKNAHGGCWNVNVELNDGQKVGFSLSVEHPDWRGIRMVKAEKVILHKKPDETDNAHAYVVQGDVVFVIEDRGTWLHVEYVNIQKEGAKTTGWVQASSLLSVGAP